MVDTPHTHTHSPMNKRKEYDKELNERKTSNLSDKKFKTLVTKMLNEVQRRLDELSKNFNKENENIKKKQLEIKNLITNGGGIARRNEEKIR